MDHKDILTSSATILNKRAEQYGDMREVMHRASLHASLLLGKEVSKYEVATIMTAIKMARIPSSIGLMDNYIDGINYMSFAGEFAVDEAKNTKSDEELYAGISEIARKFAPLRHSDDSST
jgi:hypothetical protein